VAEENRRLRSEIEVLKEGLYAARNDLAETQFQQRNQQDRRDSEVVQLSKKFSAVEFGFNHPLPSFAVPGISVERSPPQWDADFSGALTTISSVDGVCIASHSGESKGWAVAIAKEPIRIGQSVSFSILGEGQQSALMVGFVTRRSAPGNGHLGMMPGSWAWQGSGFLWSGDVALCCGFEGADSNDAMFGAGDSVALLVEPRGNGAAVRCLKNGTSVGIGAASPCACVAVFPAVSFVGRMTISIS
jgi:hypothetical protein